jgi:asparagine synthase (glutamine-hydrolysing)
VCGIAGLLGRPGHRSDDELAELGRAMADAVAHRGPDGDGTWTDAAAGLVLAHRRLAVVGLGASGAQPMVSRSGRCVLTYNGEIYNEPEIRGRLEGIGVRFRGTSDTETLVEAVDAWGVKDALRAVDGMFAFAVWDRAARTLTLARDRIGEKPLSYGMVGGAFAFGSELTSLRRVPGFHPTPDPAAVALFLRFKYVPAPWTIHAGIRKLPPGCLLTVEPDLVVGEPEPYWSLAEVVEAGARNRRVDSPELLDELDTVLGDAVEARLRADVPVGTFLSGGIDSSIVSLLAAERHTGPLRTFTIASGDADFDESSSARRVAAAAGAEHTELLVSASDALARVPTLARVHDEPFADSSQLPTLLVSELARRDVTVVLSGDGGDEIFGGYNRHVFLPSVWTRAGRVPAGVRRLAARAALVPSPSRYDRLARFIPEQRRPRLVGLKVEKLATAVGAADVQEAYARLVSHWQDPEAVVVGAREPATLTHDAARWPALDSLAEQIMAVDALTYLPDDVLVKVDRASMAVALEARVPLLSPRVIELAASMPIEARIRAGQGKWALRELLKRRLPADLVDRPKSGFGVPIATWLRGPLRPWAEELLGEQSLAAGGLLDPAPIRRAWADHLSGRRDASYQLWDVLMLQGWLADPPT